ncbi:MAG: Xaa-Pro peptidase family protein [Acidimicrobiia bacterium]
MPFDHAGRISRIQDLMQSSEVDVVVLSVGADLPYLTGYEAMESERLTALVIRPSGDPVLLVPELEAPRVVPGPFDLRPWGELEDPIALATSIVADPSRVAVGNHMWSVFLIGFQERWAGASWIPVSPITSKLRIEKDADEVDLLRQAAHGVDRVMARIPREVSFSGRTESEVARDLARLTVEEGHDSAEFTIVASGPNGASPHHHPGNRVIEPGDLVVCDYGGRWSGYHSDSTRAFVVGDPTPRQKETHEVVMEANEAGRAVVSPGTECQEVDRAARAVVEEAGLGEHFIHRTGHGIGLEVHEHPYIVEGNEMPLRPGMAFSVEPGVYLPGRLGVRIEDIVVCTQDGVETLNTADRSLISVG